MISQTVPDQSLASYPDAVNSTKVVAAHVANHFVLGWTHLLLKWTWDSIEDKWKKVYEILKKYVNEFKTAKVPQKMKYLGYNLGEWVSKKRKLKSKLDKNKRKQLNDLPDWYWQEAK